MTDSPRKWKDLPATAQVDAALRRAAAGVVNAQLERDNPGVVVCEAPSYWTPDLKRNQLARVFAAAHQGSLGKMGFLGSLMKLWELALTEPSAALCGLLDLLSVPVPLEWQDRAGDKSDAASNT